MTLREFISKYKKAMLDHPDAVIDNYDGKREPFLIRIQYKGHRYCPITFLYKTLNDTITSTAAAHSVGAQLGLGPLNVCAIIRAADDRSRDGFVRRALLEPREELKC